MRSATFLLSLPLAFTLVACSSGEGDQRKPSRKAVGTNTSDSKVSSSDNSPAPSAEESPSDNATAEKKPTPSTPSPAPAPAGNPNEGAANSSYSGNWHLGNCMPSGDPAYKSLTYEININGASLQKILKYYSDAACTVLMSGTDFQASFKVKGASPVVAGASEIDLLVTTFKVDIGDQAGADLHNKNKMCGKSDWKIGDSFNCIQGGTMAEFDIIAIKNNRLHLGEMKSAADGRTVEKRPAALGSIGFVKK